jgi:hypothetical protein
VFALNLIVRKSAKNPIDLIRRKFSIDTGRSHHEWSIGGSYHFETIARRRWKPDIHHSHRMRGRATSEKPAKSAVLDGGPARFSVRLMSL